MPSLHTPVSDRDFHQGDLKAPLQIVHFGDFECPYSGALHRTIKQLQSEEGANLLYVFRPFPLADIHPHAQIAARAAYAANDQGKFWPMYDALFENQNALGASFLRSYAEQLGLDAAAFENALHANAHDTHIAASAADAKASGAHGTPTTFINGHFHDNREGMWQMERLRAAIQAAG